MNWKWMAPTALILSLSFVAAAQQTCDGEKPILHDDGRYAFNTESWVRAVAGVHHYGRCIDVVPPTEKLLNTWVDVLPSNSIARIGRPTKGGSDYVTRDTVDASTTLYYGNSDDETDASFLAHSRELNRRAETGDPADRSAIAEMLERLGRLSLRSFHQVSFLIEREDADSLTDLDLTFVSHKEGGSHRYVINYTLDMQSPDYSDRKLLIEFPGASLSGALFESTGLEAVTLQEGSDEITFNHDQASDSDFIRSLMRILNEDGDVLTELPVTYMLPVQ